MRTKRRNNYDGYRSGKDCRDLSWREWITDKANQRVHLLYKVDIHFLALSIKIYLNYRQQYNVK